MSVVGDCRVWQNGGDWLPNTSCWAWLLIYSFIFNYLINEKKIFAHAGKLFSFHDSRQRLGRVPAQVPYWESDPPRAGSHRLHASRRRTMTPSVAASFWMLMRIETSSRRIGSADGHARFVPARFGAMQSEKRISGLDGFRCPRSEELRSRRAPLTHDLRRRWLVLV